METFSGDNKSNWDSFIFQFERQARKFHWKERKKLDKLLDCLKDKALEYSKELDAKTFKKLKKKLNKRFSRREEPVAARRQLLFIRQKDDKKLVDFADRVQSMVSDGHPGAREKTLHRLSAEVFLKGCREKDAAQKAMDKEPKDTQKALKYVKRAVNNRTALFGTKSVHATRQVTFADDDRSPSESEEYGVRTMQVAKSGFRNFQSKPSTTNTDGVSLLAAALADLLKDAEKRSRQQSPSPAASPQRKEGLQCFGCQEYGHIRKNCPSPTASPQRKEGLQCFGCHEYGHIRPNCPKGSPRRQPWKPADKGTPPPKLETGERSPLNREERC
jgi:hypothetical protein